MGTIYPRVRGSRVYRQAGYVRSLAERVGKALVQAKLPGEVQDEVRSNLEEVIKSVDGLAYAEGPFDEYDVIQRAKNFFVDLRDKLMAVELLETREDRRLLRALEEAISELEASLRGHVAP